MTVQATFAATLVDEWARAGVTDAVVAPGSRSTPLTLALAADGRMRVHVFLDERSAGFFGLGLGLATGRPAVVVTTSGTAAVELHAAVVEASQARVPLLVCTADRPVELQSVGAPQTIDQSRLFGSAVRWFVEPGVADGVPSASWRSLASRLVVEAVEGSGPVHANLAFRDPLVADPGELPDGRGDGQPWHRSTFGRDAAGIPASARPKALGVVVAGAGSPVGDVVALAEGMGWPVLADPRSGLRGSANAVAAFDGVLRAEAFVRAMVPDVVVRVGSPPASKVLSQWLAALPPSCEQVLVDPSGRWLDPERVSAVRVDRVPAAADGPGAAEPAWLDSWLAAEAAAQAAIDDVLSRHDEPTEPGVLRAVTRDAPPTTTLFVSSSMPVRDVEWFGHPSSRHVVLSNRGANGIDGVVSTALGVAAGAAAPVVAVVGDLAFLYDAGALLWATRRDVDLTIVVLDNDGGGIFSFLPQREHVPHERFEQVFGTPHGVDLASVAAAYGVPAVAAVGEGTGVRLVHVRTEREANVALHAAIAAAVTAAMPSSA